MLGNIFSDLISAKPSGRIFFNGDDATGVIAGMVVSLEASQSVDEHSDGMTLVLEDTERRTDVPKRGARMEVWLGYGRNQQKLGAYIVDEVELSGAPNQIRITGTSTPFTSDAFGGQASMITRRSQSYDGKTVADILQIIAARNGLKAKVQEELAGVYFSHIDQVDESDTNFLLRIARDIGGILTPMDSTLVLVDERGGKTTSGKPVDNVYLTEDQVISWRVTLGHRLNDAKKHSCQYHDYSSATTKEVRVDVPKNEIWKASGDQSED